MLLPSFNSVMARCRFVRTPGGDDLVIGLRVDAGTGESEVAHLDAQRIDVGNFLVQLPAVPAIHIGKYVDISLALAVGLEHDHVLLAHIGKQCHAAVGANPVRQVDEAVALHRIHVSREQKTAVGGAVQNAAVFKLQHQQAVELRFPHRFDRHVRPQRLEFGHQRIARRCLSQGRQSGGDKN